MRISFIKIIDINEKLFYGIFALSINYHNAINHLNKIILYFISIKKIISDENF